MTKIVQRQFTRIEREVNGVKRQMFVASSDASDRYGDIVDQASWKLDNYKANPVVQVNHDYSVEATVGIGRASVEMVDGKAMLMLEVVQWSSSPRAQQVKADVEGGILNAVSVGFRPGRSVARNSYPVDDERYADDSGYGRVYFDCELLEVSIVAVPANQEALAVRGLNLDAVVEQVLQRLAAARVNAAPAPAAEKQPESLEVYLNSILKG